MVRSGLPPGRHHAFFGKISFLVEKTAGICYIILQDFLDKIARFFADRRPRAAGNGPLRQSLPAVRTSLRTWNGCKAKILPEGAHRFRLKNRFSPLAISSAVCKGGTVPVHFPFSQNAMAFFHGSLIHDDPLIFFGSAVKYKILYRRK